MATCISCCKLLFPELTSSDARGTEQSDQIIKTNITWHHKYRTCKHAYIIMCLFHIYPHFLILSKPWTVHRGELSSFHGTRNQRRKSKQLKTDFKEFNSNRTVLMKINQYVQRSNFSPTYCKALHYSCKSTNN